MVRSLTITATLARQRGCSDGIDNAREALGRDVGDDEPVPLTELVALEAVSLEDVVRAVFVAGPDARRAYRHWIVDVYEARRLAALEVLPVFERDRPGDDRPRKALDSYPAAYQGAREVIVGHGTLDDLIERRYTSAADAAYAAYAAYAASAADAAYAASAADAADAEAAARQKWNAGFRAWCRRRLGARLAGEVPTVADDPTLAPLIAELRAAVAAKVA